MDGGKVVSITLQAALYHSVKFLVLILFRGPVDPRAIVRLEESGQVQKSTTLELETKTFPLVAQ
jgi:hypothetical protein